MRFLTAVLLAAGAAAACSGSEADPDSEDGGTEPRVRPGVEVLLSDSLHLIEGLQVGLITNQTGVDRRGTSSIDRLAEHGEVELAALFSPEHGIRGEAEAGREVEDEVDERTGLPVHSLYGETRRPSPEMLAGLEALLFDIQDIGSRYYTYVSTMALAMEEAARAGLPFLVLDRPNPIGGARVQGNVLEPAHASFVGLHPVPMRHGMTAGELARVIEGEFGIGARLHVVPAEGWRRELWFDDTGLPWVAPSPNMPDLASATHYPGTCLFEGTNLSVGRGTGAPFRQIGAPWLDGEKLADRLNALELAGVRFEAAEFTPRDPGDGKYADEPVRGVRFRATDRVAYDPTLAAVAALLETRVMSGDRWEWRASHFDRLAGTDRLRREIERVPAGGPTPETLAEIAARWKRQLVEFRERRERYLIYP